jgi:PilZ domain
MNQRKEPRRGYFARITVTYRNEDGMQLETQGMIEDRSESGLGIRIGKPLVPGCQVQVRHGSKVYVGVVRRCSRSGAEYFVGIALERTANPTANGSTGPSATDSRIQ